MNFSQWQDAIYKYIVVKAPMLFFGIFESALVIIAAALTIKILKALITQFFHRQKNFKYTIDDKRADTLSTLLSSAVKYIIYILAFLVIINGIFKINLMAIITAAGIGTVVLGIWAQSFVRDIIAGFFILLEDHFAVGDTVTIDTMNGVVEEIQLRITKIRHYNGDLFIIPNGEIKKATNHTRGSKMAIVDVHVSYQEDLDKVIKVLDKVLKEVTQEKNVAIEEPKVLGITEFGISDMTIRVVAKASPSDNAEIERMLRKKIKDTFDNEGILIPFKAIDK